MKNLRNRFVVIVISALCIIAPSFAFASFDTNLNYGASGSAVLSLQQFLVAQNYQGSGSWMETGYFGKATVTAVQQFQNQQGINPTSGFFGPLTRARANAVAANGGSIPTTIPTTVPINNGSNVATLIASLQAQVQQLEAQIATLNGTNNSQPQSCTFNNQSIASGSSVVAYQYPNVSSGQSCQSQTRTCNNGNLSESFLYGSCSVQQPIISCPNYQLLACTNGTLVPQGRDSNGCQLPPQCVPNTSSQMKLSAVMGGSGAMNQMPRIMNFSASYPVSSFTNPNDTAAYTINYGDGSSGTLTYQNVGCPVDGGGSCMAVWPAPDHSYTIPGEYTATLYKNGTQIDSTSFLAFAADIQSSTPAGPAGPSGPTGAMPLAVTFTFTGGTYVDYGDGTNLTLCSNCTQWSNTVHTLTHTYTTPGFHQMTVSFNGIGMEGAGISVLSGTVTSISPSSGPIGTSVIIYGSGFTSAGDVNFLSLCSGSNPNCGNFTLKNFTVAPDDLSVTFTIPSTYTTNTMSCTFGGGGCTTTTSQTNPVLPAMYSVGFDGTGFVGLPLQFTVTQ